MARCTAVGPIGIAAGADGLLQAVAAGPGRLGPASSAATSAHEHMPPSGEQPSLFGRASDHREKAGARSTSDRENAGCCHLERDVGSRAVTDRVAAKVIDDRSYATFARPRARAPPNFGALCW